MKITNRRAYRDYEVEERFEAGIKLKGWEAKSIRQGRLQFGNGYVRIRGGEVWLVGVRIPRYEFTGDEVEEQGTRKLLLSKKEIRYLEQKVQTKRVTLVPLSIYTKRNLVKVEVGLVKGRREFEKRERIKKRDLERDVEREMKRYS